MKNIKNIFAWGNTFIRNNIFLLIVIALGGFWLFDNEKPIHFRSAVGNIGGYDHFQSEAVDMEASPMMGKAVPQSARMMIEPPIVHADDFEPEASERKIIKNANLELEVEDTEKSKIETETQVKDFGGNVTNMNSWEVRSGVLAYNMTIRIPAEKFEKSIEALTFLGIKKNESFSTSDITAQYRDNTNRLKNLETRRERLRNMMERKTENLSDVLQIDRELSNVQLQIENLESTLRRHDVNVSHSTLRLTLRPEPQIGDVENPHWSFSRSWKSSLNNLIQDSQSIADKFIIILVYIPLWVPLLILLWWIKKKITKSQKKK
jgi:hypothetical protein